MPNVRIDTNGGTSSFDTKGAGLTTAVLTHGGSMPIPASASEGEKDRAAYTGADASAKKLAVGMKPTTRPFSNKGGKTVVKSHFRKGKPVKSHTRR